MPDPGHARLFRLAGFTAIVVVALALVIGANTAARPASRALRAPVAAPPCGADADWRRIQQFLEEAAERLGRVPGVIAAGGIDRMPRAGAGTVSSFQAVGRRAPTSAQPVREEIRVVAPGYFEARNVPLLRGRTIRPTDRRESPLVAVVSRAFAERYWPAKNPIGKRIRMIRGQPHWRTVVGVVADVREFGLDAATRPQVYVPHAQDT